MSAPSTHPLTAFLAQARRPALILYDGTAEPVLDELPTEGVVVRQVGQEVPGAPRRWPAVALVVADAVAFRRAASALGNVGGTRSLAWWLIDADEPALVIPRPEWPEVIDLEAHQLRAGAFTSLRTERPVGARAVVAHVARSLSTARSGHHGLVVATTDPTAAHVPPADASLLVVESVTAAADPALPVPPDVVLGSDPPAAGMPEHPVIGRPPVVVNDPDLLVGPLDEGLLNPIGFVRDAGLDPVTLTSDPDAGVRLVGEGVDLAAPRGEVGPSTVATLRDHAGVHLAWTDPLSVEQVRTIAALAMSGVPLLGFRSSRSGSGDRGPRLGPALTTALARDVDVTDRLAREEHSVRVRRAALLEHSTLAWRRRLGTRCGVDVREFPTVTAVVSARNGDDLELTLGHLARQRGVDLEIVAVTRGFSPDRNQTRERPEPAVTTVEVPSTCSASEALDRGLDAAAGDLVAVMDAGHWYDADLVADLLLARHYTGAALVGTGRTGESERFVTSLADGPWLIGRRRLRDLGGLLRADTVGALAAAVLALGEDVYVTHGLGHAPHLEHQDTDEETPTVDPRRHS